MHRSSLTRTLAACLLMTAGTLALAACSTASKTMPTLRAVTAQRIAGPAHLVETHIPAGEFTLMAFERVGDKGRPATVYIEGDGNIGWNDLTVPWTDPTPVQPAALQMAADDNSANVIYLGRPCQYAGAMDTRPCTRALFTTHRYSPQAINAVSAALDNLKKRYSIPSFSLVGYEGGAAVAVELAAVRDDITSLRTVGGVLDTRIAAPKEKMSPWMDPFAGSLNPVDAAPKVADIPQTHEVAAWNKAQSLAMINSFLAAQGKAPMAMAAPAPLPQDTVPAPDAMPDSAGPAEPMALND